MTEVRVEHLRYGIIGRVIWDEGIPVVQWEDTGRRTSESWNDLKRLDDEPTLADFELPPGMYPDSDMGCTD